MTIYEDEKLKALIHGIWLGCGIPIVAFNLILAAQRKRRNVINSIVYGGFVVFELYHILGHVRACHPHKEKDHV